jgi:hypothetical protein
MVRGSLPFSRANARLSKIMNDNAAIDWLAHRWPFEVHARTLQAQTRYDVCVGRLSVSGHEDEADAAAWIAAVRLESLAVIVARHRKLHPVLVLIEGSAGRLARIPPELWATYDGLVVSVVDRYVSVLSAKARSLYEGDPSVFVRIHKAPRPEARRRQRT